jgi:hypothetical protein
MPLCEVGMNAVPSDWRCNAIFMVTCVKWGIPAWNTSFTFSAIFPRFARTGLKWSEPPARCNANSISATHPVVPGAYGTIGPAQKPRHPPFRRTMQSSGTAIGPPLSSILCPF